MLAVVLIVLLVMMGASFLQMARSDRRSTQQMDTRADDYTDNELQWALRTWITPDLPNQTPDFRDDSGAFRRGEDRIDYPFTWSGTVSPAGVPTVPGDIRDDIQGGEWLTYPVELSALGSNPAAIANPADNGAPLVDPRPGADTTNLIYRAAGVGPGRSAFLGEISEARAATSGFPNFAGYADRGQNDDAWLASTQPVFSNQFPNGDSVPGVPPATQGGSAYWPHISNMRGVFLDLGNTVTLADGSELPRAYLSTADNQFNSGDTWLNLATMQASFLADNGIFTDADNDGVADARWTYAAATSGGGLTYVAAWRIVDNSSLVNLNTASVNGSGSGDARQRPRWYNPSDLALDPAFTQDVGIGGAYVSAGQANAALADLMAAPGGGAGVRGHDTSPGGVPALSYVHRLTGWLLTGQRYDNPSNGYDEGQAWDYIGSGLQQLAAQGVTGYDPPGGLTPSLVEATDFQTAADAVAPTLGTLARGNRNESELRNRNGLNRTQDALRTYPDTELEQLVNPEFWRADVPIDSVETRYGELYYSTAGTLLTPTIQQFFENEPRKRFTTASGSGDFLRVNLNQADRNEVRDFFDKVDEFGTADWAQEDWDLKKQLYLLNGAQDTTLHQNFPLLAADRADLRGWGGFARAAGAFVEDWRDLDHREVGGNLKALPELTVSRSGTGLTFYGMEYLPFISEVYVQARYQTNGSVRTGTGATVGAGQPADELDWRATGDVFLAIGIGTDQGLTSST
ncbi:MAG: hypothetical protein AAF663_07420, partial [Planctomycetota bacterium]